MKCNNQFIFNAFKDYYKKIYENLLMFKKIYINSINRKNKKIYIRIIKYSIF